MAQLTAQEPIQAFFAACNEYRRECRVAGNIPTSLSPRPFIAAHSLVKNFFQPQNYSRLWAILDCFDDYDADDATVRTIGDEWPVVFAILLAIGEPQYIFSFIENPTLRTLPMTYLNPPEYFPRFSAYDHEDNLYQRYKAKQWEFLPVTFKQHHQVHSTDYILPFTAIETLIDPVQKDSASKIFKVQIDPAYRTFHPEDQQVSPNAFAVEAHLNTSHSCQMVSLRSRGLF